jgi:hypothetical protein
MPTEKINIARRARPRPQLSGQSSASEPIAGLDLAQALVEPTTGEDLSETAAIFSMPATLEVAATGWSPVGAANEG